MLDNLDGSEELVDIDLDIDATPLPAKNSLVALIDADTLVFTACLNTEEEVEILPEEFYTKEQWEEILADPQFDEKTHTTHTIDMDLAVAKAEEKLQRIMDKTGCITCELHFTGGRENFRYDVYTDYKANRTGSRPPAGLRELKQLMLERYTSTISTKWEADDMVVYLKNKKPDDYLLVAVDKDVLNAVPGRHFNYYESLHHNKEMKFIEIDEDHARVWPYKQAIMGDPGDNIPGCKGIGPKKSDKFVNASMTDTELWEGVVAAWESKGHTAIDALITMNLVNMNLLQEIEGELQIVKWTPYD